MTELTIVENRSSKVTETKTIFQTDMTDWQEWF